jgi:ubiquinone/menaquinone biosynthesis C-methylase UbiE
MDPYDNKEIAKNFGINEEYTGSVSVRNKLRKIVSGWLSGTIIDAGCGNGLLLENINNYNLYVGADRSIEMLKVAKKKNKVNAYFVQADLNNLPFKDKIVDNVVCIDALHHLPDDETELNAIKELNRVGRNFIFEIKSFDFLSPLRRLFFNISKSNKKDTEIDKISYNSIKLGKVIKSLKQLGKNKVKVKRVSLLVDWRLIKC